MNEWERLVLLKEQDRTKDIEEIEKKGEFYQVKYKNKDKPYKYRKDNVKILKKGEPLEIDNKTIYYKENRLYLVKKVLRFEEYAKIFFLNGETETYLYREISFRENEKKDQSENILNYFNAIAKYAKGKENLEDEENNSKNNETFLEREYKKLKFINQESILHLYLHQLELKKEENVNVELIYPFGINPSQKKAIENVYKKNLSIIEGPPGTGKTQTILNIIINLAILQNKTVAVVSNNNEAVKNVKEKLAKKGYEFIVAHLGKKERREEFFDALPEFQVEGFEIKNKEPLQDQFQKLNNNLKNLLEKNNRKAELEREIEVYKLEQSYFNLYYEEGKTLNIEDLPFKRKEPDELINFLIDYHLLEDDKVVFPFLQKIKLYLKYGIKKQDKTLNDIFLQVERLYYQEKIKKLEEEYDLLVEELIETKFEELLEEHTTLSNQILKNKLYEKYHNRKINYTLDNYLTDFSSFIDTFPIILSTTYSLRNSVPKEFIFDYVIIDESSQVDLLAGSLALSVAKKAIIVGDTKQLPQIVDEKIKDQIGEYKIDSCFDYFNCSLLSALIMSYPDAPHKTLKEHYRCHPKIIEFCNKRYYNGKLIPFKNEEHEKIKKPLILETTPPGNHLRVETKNDKNNYFNQRELEIIKEEVLNREDLAKYPENEIGITTPYRYQASELTKILEQAIESDTIHKYQGKEKDLMVLSTVLDESKYGKWGIHFVDDACMLNVAVSRAKLQFVIVTHSELFKKYGTEIKALIKYMKYNTQDSEILESNLISVFDLLYKEYSKKLENLSHRLGNKYKYKSENIMDAILKEEFNKEQYKDYIYVGQENLKNILKITEQLSNEEIEYIKHNASIDFAVHDKNDGKPLLFIEVDGFHFHRNNKEQSRRDALKNSIAQKMEIKLLRFETYKCYSEETIKKQIQEALWS